MCKYETHNRYEAYKILRHPWITRSPRSVIPYTMIEAYKKDNLINKFKIFLSVFIFFSAEKYSNHQNYSNIKVKKEI